MMHGQQNIKVYMFPCPHDGAALEVLPHSTGVLAAVYGIVGGYLEGINFLG